MYNCGAALKRLSTQLSFASQWSNKFGNLLAQQQLKQETLPYASCRVVFRLSVGVCMASNFSEGDPTVATE